MVGHAVGGLSGYPLRVLNAVLFWASVAALGWVYLGYPALVFLLARSRPVVLRPTQPAPTLSVAIAVHNEEAHIAERIDDVLAQAASGASIVEVLVGSDGSTDATDQIVRDLAAADPRIRLLSLPRGGQTPTQSAMLRSFAVVNLASPWAGSTSCAAARSSSGTGPNGEHGADGAYSKRADH